jgi:hypothetical protein
LIVSASISSPPIFRNDSIIAFLLHVSMPPLVLVAFLSASFLSGVRKMKVVLVLGLVVLFAAAVSANWENKLSGETYLDNKAKEEGMHKLPSGLLFKPLRVASVNGKAAHFNSEVRVHYEARFINGTAYDSSYARNIGAVIRPMNVVAGWTEALAYMGEGDKWELHLPFQLAYGERGHDVSGRIGPHTALVYDLEVVEVFGMGKSLVEARQRLEKLLGYNPLGDRSLIE